MLWLILKEYHRRLAGRIIYGWTLNGTPTQPNYLRRYLGTRQNAGLFCIYLGGWSYCLALCGIGQLPRKVSEFITDWPPTCKTKGDLDKRELELFSHELIFKFNFVKNSHLILKRSFKYIIVIYTVLSSLTDDLLVDECKISYKQWLCTLKSGHSVTLQFSERVVTHFARAASISKL